MKIVVATGGSGGHIIPAVTVARELIARHEASIVVAGSFERLPEILKINGLDWKDLGARPLKEDSVFSIIVSCWIMLKSYCRSLYFLFRQKPDCVLGFGGYGAFPIVLAAACLGIPTLIHEQNVLPGRANRLLGRCVKRVLLTFPESLRFFSSRKAAVVGYPVRQLQAGNAQEARISLGLQPEVFTVLVLGGSQGSRFLNENMVLAFAELEKEMAVQVIHVAGERDIDDVKRKYEQSNIPACVFGFLNDVSCIYQAGDIAVTRAGAGSLHELKRFSIPCVIVPYPYAGEHQFYNAQAFAKDYPAIVLNEKQATPSAISRAIKDQSGLSGKTEAEAGRPGLDNIVNEITKVCA